MNGLYGCYGIDNTSRAFLERLVTATLLEKKSTIDSPPIYRGTPFYVLTETGKKYFDDNLKTFFYGHVVVDKVLDKNMVNIKEGGNTYSECTVRYKYHTEYAPWVSEELKREISGTSEGQGTGEVTLKSINGSQWQSGNF